MSVVLTTVLLLTPLPKPTPKEIGPGTEISFDKGYWVHPDPYVEEDRQWLAIPTTLVVIGEEEIHQADTGRRVPCLVCVEKGDRPPYGEFFLLRKDKLTAGQVLKAVPGKLEPVRTVVESAYAPVTLPRKP